MEKSTRASATGMPTGQSLKTVFDNGAASLTTFPTLLSTSFTTTSTAINTTTRQRPATSAGEWSIAHAPSQLPEQLPPLPPVSSSSSTPDDQHRANVLTKERRPSLNKKPSFTRSRGSISGSNGPSGSLGASAGAVFQPHQRSKSTSSIRGGPGAGIGGGSGGGHGGSPKKTATGSRSYGTGSSSSGNAATRPPLPAGWASATASAIQRRDSPNPFTSPHLASTIAAAAPAARPNTLRLTNPEMIGGALVAPTPTGLGISMSGGIGSSSLTSSVSEGSALHQHIHDMVNKRISTLDYLRKAHDGRVYWFNTLRFDRPDMARMPYFDSRRLARRATNYMMLGLSLPAVVDLNSTSATELLRSLSALLSEFDQFQQLHSETGSGSGASSLSRAARLPNMFRRATPSSKVRRASSSTTSGSNDIGMPGGSFDGGVPGAGGIGNGGATVGSLPGGDSFGGSALTLVNSESAGSVNGANLSSSFSSVGGATAGGAQAQQQQQLQQQTPHGAASSGVASTAFATYYDNNTDLLPGEEYAFLLTPSLPFDPDFFETFATLCDVLIDCYQRILALLPSPRECSPLIMELFGKADSRVRKLLVQGVVKEFEDHSRSGVKTEVANIGKVVLSGLM